MVALFERFKEFREKWSLRSPLDKHKFLYDFTSSFVEKIGLRFMSDCRVFWSSYILAVVILSYLFFTFYTLYYYQSQNDFVSGLNPISAIGNATAVKKI